MELNIREFLLGKSQRIACVGKEYIAIVLILCHIGVLATLEVGKLLGIVALDPTSLVNGDRIPTTLCTILVLKTVLDNLELKLTYGADNLATVQRGGEELCNTLVHKLVDTLGELLELHRVGILDIAEKLR